MKTEKSELRRSKNPVEFFTSKFSFLHGFGMLERVDLSLIVRVLAFTLAIGVAAALVFGLAPVFQLLRGDTLAALRDEGGAVATPLPQVCEVRSRTQGDPMAILPAVRQVLRDVDSRLALARPRPLAEEFERSVTGQLTMATLVGVLSGIALALAAVGLYGVMAYATRQRTSEVGLRLALGATPASILTLIVMQGARLVVVGVSLGLFGAFASVRFVRGQLFGVEVTDPVTWLVVSAVLAIVGLAACAIPAHRAMRVDPAVARRSS